MHRDHGCKHCNLQTAASLYQTRKCLEKAYLSSISYHNNILNIWHRCVNSPTSQITGLAWYVINTQGCHIHFYQFIWKVKTSWHFFYFHNLTWKVECDFNVLFNEQLTYQIMCVHYHLSFFGAVMFQVIDILSHGKKCIVYSIVNTMAALVLAT